MFRVPGFGFLVSGIEYGASGIWYCVLGSEVWGLEFRVSSQKRCFKPVSLKSIRPQTGQLDFITRNSEGKVDGFVGELTSQKWGLNFLTWDEFVPGGEARARAPLQIL